MNLYVADTNALISYYCEVFGEPNLLSANALGLLTSAIELRSPFVQISIPGIVFVEIYEKWLLTEEFVRKFYFEVFQTLKNHPNVELRVIDSEILENLTQIQGTLANHEINDKLVLASAISLQCPLISTDRVIREYVEQTGVIPDVIS